MGYFDTLLRYFEFSGRSSRSQYWLFQLVFGILLAGAVYADYRAMGNQLPDAEHPGLFVTFVSIFHAMPQLTVTIRRLHDTGRSGWNWLWNFVPFGSLVVLVWTCQGSEIGPNRFGADPRVAPMRDDDEPIQYRGVRLGPPKERPSLDFNPQTASTARFI